MADKRNVTYCRASSDEANQPFTLDGQKARLEPLIEGMREGPVVARYVERASGATLDRPELQRLLRDAERGRFDTVWVVRLDRLSRSVRDVLDLIEKFDNWGVTLRSASQNIDTSTPAGRFQISMLASFAEDERGVLIDRITAGKRAKAARGEWHGGQPPLGFRVENSVLVPVADEIALVHTIFDLYITTGLGARAIANKLNDEGPQEQARWPVQPRAHPLHPQQPRVRRRHPLARRVVPGTPRPRPR